MTRPDLSPWEWWLANKFWWLNKTSQWSPYHTVKHDLIVYAILAGLAALVWLGY